MRSGFQNWRRYYYRNVAVTRCHSQSSRTKNRFTLYIYICIRKILEKKREKKKMKEKKKRKICACVCRLLEYRGWSKSGKQLRSSLRRVIKARSGEQYENRRCWSALRTKPLHIRAVCVISFNDYERTSSKESYLHSFQKNVQKKANEEWELVLEKEYPLV